MKRSKSTVKLSKTQYRVESTGEIKDISPYSSKTDNKGNTQQSYNRLRELICDNISVNGKSYYTVLTYEESQSDIKAMNTDVKAFHRKLGNDHEYEYIQIPELTENGVWHMNVLIALASEEYFEYKKVSEAWGKGRVETQKIYNVEGIADYLCLDVTKKGERNHKNSSKVNRLNDYPAGMKLYSYSNGIRKGKKK